MQPIAFQKGVGLLFHLALIDQTETGWLAPDEQVGSNRDIWQEIYFLIYRTNPQRLGISSTDWLDRFSVKKDLASRTFIDTGEGLNHCGLTGAVLT